MKKILVFMLMALVAVSVFADTNTRWFHQEEYGVMHNTQDFLTYNNTNKTTLYAEDYSENARVTFCFSDTVVKGKIIVMVIVSDELILDEDIIKIAYGDDMDNITDYFTPFSTTSGGFSLSAEDSSFLYYDMLYASQKFFTILTKNNMICFNVNCKNLYKYNSYLF